MFSSIMLFAQATAANAVDAAAGAGVTYETIPEPGLGVGKALLLAIYSLISLGLIGCVLAQTHKSEGLSQSMMGGSAAAAPYKCKKSSQDRLDSADNTLAASFIGLSIVMFFIYH